MLKTAPSYYTNPMKSHDKSSYNLSKSIKIPLNLCKIPWAPIKTTICDGKKSCSKTLTRLTRPRRAAAEALQLGIGKHRSIARDTHLEQHHGLNLYPKAASQQHFLWPFGAFGVFRVSSQLWCTKSIKKQKGILLLESKRVLISKITAQQCGGTITLKQTEATAKWLQHCLIDFDHATSPLYTSYC